MPHLFGNQPDASWVHASTSSSGRTWGMRFQVTTACTATRMAWWKHPDNNHCRQLLLFNQSGTKLWETGYLSWFDASEGWKWQDISGGIALVPGVTYTAAFSHDGPDDFSRNTSAPARAPAPAPFIHDDALSYITTAGPGQYPTSNSSGDGFFGVTVDTDFVEPPPPGPGEGDPTTTGDLNSWLSADTEVQTHETDGLPWLTKVAVDASRAVVDGISGAVTNIGDAIGDVADAASATGSLMARVAEILARIPVNILNSIKLTGEWLLSWFGTGARPEGAPTIPDALDQLLSAQEDAGGQLGTLWHRTETSNWLVSVPGTDWVLQDTLEWDAPFAWNQPADCYIVHLTAVPTYVTSEDVAGTAYYSKAAWWAPLTGTLPHERHYCEFEFQVLHALPMRCEGILFRPRNNFAGTIEAWLRPEATTP